MDPAFCMILLSSPCNSLVKWNFRPTAQRTKPRHDGSDESAVGNPAISWQNGDPSPVLCMFSSALLLPGLSSMACVPWALLTSAPNPFLPSTHLGLALNLGAGGGSHHFHPVHLWRAGLCAPKGSTQPLLVTDCLVRLSALSPRLFETKAPWPGLRVMSDTAHPATPTGQLSPSLFYTFLDKGSNHRTKPTASGEAGLENKDAISQPSSSPWWLLPWRRLAGRTPGPWQGLAGPPRAGEDAGLPL